MTWESDHVEQARSRGVPWFHVAAQVGKCEHDIRRRYDPTMQAEDAAPEPVAEPAPVQPTRRAAVHIVRRAGAPYAVKHASRRGMLLAHLASVGETITAAACVALKWDSKKTSSCMGDLQRRGFASTPSYASPYVWRITDKGRAALALMKPRGRDK